MSPSPRRYRAAIIGHTGRGNYGHGLDICFNGLAAVEVVALADPDPAGRAAAQQRSGAPRAYADYRVMLEQERPDLVAIAPRWVGQRLAMVEAATAAGAHLYVEKPLAATVDEADAIVARARQAGVRLAVAHQYRLHPGTAHIQHLLATGRIGRLRLVRGYGKMDHRGGGQDLMVLGTHILDLMRLFAGDARWCSADLLVGSRLATAADQRAGDEEIGPVLGDGLRALYGFDDEVLGTFESYHSLGGGDTLFGLDLVGERGQLAYRGSFTRRIFYSPYPYAEPGLPGDGWELVPIPEAGPGEQLGDEPGDDQGRAELVQRANQRVILDLLAAIETGREPICSGERARDSLELIQAVAAAHAAGGRISLPLRDRRHPHAMLPPPSQAHQGSSGG